MKIKSHKQLVEEASLEIENLTPEEAKVRLDDNTIFIWNKKIEGADPNTFEIIYGDYGSFTSSTIYSKDSIFKCLYW